MIRSRNKGSAVGPLLWAFALAAMLLAVSLSATSANSAHAQQGPIEDGGTIVFRECVIVSITVLESDAKFTSVFHRFNPNPADPGVDLGVHSLQVNETALIGQVPVGQELILGIVVDETGNTFKTGPGSRNASTDGLVHAIVGDIPAVNGTLVEFEDKALGEPNADFDYDDARLELSILPCPTPEPVTLTVQVDPASTGNGGVAGSGSYDFGTVANASASPAAGSTFGGWSGDCNGLANNFAVDMNADKLCIALFLAVPVEPSPTPSPTPEAAAVAVDIDNTLVSVNPARVGETVTFRVDVDLEVPAENTADVQYTFDDSELEYISASWNNITLNQCSLSGAGVIDCAFGVVSTDFSYDLNFEALKKADASTTNATLSSDPDGAGAEAPIAAGPAAADVDIIAITGPVPPAGDGSVAGSGSTMPFQLFALLGATVLATVGAVRLRTGARS